MVLYLFFDPIWRCVRYVQEKKLQFNGNNIFYKPKWTYLVWPPFAINILFNPFVQAIWDLWHLFTDVLYREQIEQK